MPKKINEYYVTVRVELNDHSRSIHTKPEVKRSINRKEVSRYVLD